MNHAELDKLLIEIRRACPGYVGWVTDELRILASHNGTELGEERLAFRRKWEQLTERLAYADAGRVVMYLKSGAWPCPPFGQLPIFIVNQATRLRDDRLRRVAMWNERQANERRRAAVAQEEPVKVLEEFEAALAAKQTQGDHDE